MNEEGTKERLLVSHLMFRRVLGILGVALPIVLAVWGFTLSVWSLEIQDSISYYYSLRTRDAFVGILFFIAWFLFAYRGYEHKNNIAGYLACIFALGVAVFPNSGARHTRSILITCITPAKAGTDNMYKTRKQHRIQESSGRCLYHRLETMTNDGNKGYSLS